MNAHERRVGTVSRGIRGPIIRQGDDLASIVTTSVLEAADIEGFELRDRDVIAVTESVVARSQGNYATVEQIAADVKAKLSDPGNGCVGVIFPILSRNRFAICLRGIAAGCKKVVLMLSYPSDEVGNHLVSIDMLDKAGVKYEKLYVEDNEDLARHYKINQAPTLIVISGDEYVAHAGPEAIKAYIASLGNEGIA